MLKVLLKKQLMEVFRSYFYNQKKNTARSKVGTILLFVLFGVLMLGVIGGSIGSLAWLLCDAFVEAGMGWLYFIIFGLMSILLGIIGSAFNTFSGLYLAKDNDLLLAMPIPVGNIIAARLLNVYLLGLMYSGCILLPVFIVYWIFGVCNFQTILGCLVLLLLISVFVLLLSCLLGWVIAKISLKLKSKSFVTVLIALVGIGLYYFLYFKAQVLLRELIANVSVYGGKIRGSAYLLYLFGRIGEGDPLAILIYTAILAVLCVVTWLLLKKSFLSIATATGAQKKAVYREKAVRSQSADTALLKKELRRFSSSATYMLNCGLGLLFLLAAGVGLLLYGDVISVTVRGLLGPGFFAVLLSAAVCLMGSMNDMSAPSVSLEGKTIWQLQCLPVTPWQALRAKLRAHLAVCAGPMLFAVLCGVIVLPEPWYLRLLFALVCLLFFLLHALWGLFWGLKLPNLHWTSEITVIKQSGCVAFALFGGWIYGFALGGLYFLFGRDLGPAPYLGIAAAITLLLDLALFLWLKKKGATIFANL